MEAGVRGWGQEAEGKRDVRVGGGAEEGTVNQAMACQSSRGRPVPSREKPREQEELE